MSHTQHDVPDISPYAKELVEKDNQLVRPLLSVIGMAPFAGYDTSPRKQMFSGNLGAFQVIKGNTPRFIQTGMEREYGKYTFNVVAPEDIRILKLVDRYPPKATKGSIRHNPQTLIIYEEIKTKVVGCLSVENYKTNHPHFGFVYRAGPAYARLRQGAEFQKGEVFLESPNVTPDGDYAYGGEFNVAKMSVPASSEDGMIVSKSAIRRFRYHTFETRVIECDASMFPLNLYPNTERGTYGICPEIGDPIRDDGLVMALRPFNEVTSVYDMSHHGLMEFQDGYDKPFKAPPGGKVIDIQVHRNPMIRQPRVPFGMDEQLMKYYEADRDFHQEIFNEYLRLKRIRKDSLRLTPAFHSLLVYSQFPIEKDDGRLVTPYHRKAKINDWRIEITIQYLNTPGVGFKLTGGGGDKGTIVEVKDDADMPVDDFGNRADIVVDPLSTIARSILSREYEPKFNAVFRDLVGSIHQALNTNEAVCDKGRLAVLDKTGIVTEQYARLLELYNIISPDYMGKAYTMDIPKEEIYEHMASVLGGNRTLFLPPENEVRYDEAVMKLNELMPNNIGPVTYRGNSGNMVRTKEDVLIASVYFIALDKPGEDWAALNSGKLQHYGLLARINSSTKHTMSIRHQPTQVLGETENRIVVSMTPWYVAAEMMDRNNSRTTMEDIAWTLLTAEDPSNIDVLVDREKIPYGEARPLQIARHMNEGYGFRNVFVPYEPTWRHHAN